MEITLSPNVRQFELVQMHSTAMFLSSLEQKAEFNDIVIGLFQEKTAILNQAKFCYPRQFYKISMMTHWNRRTATKFQSRNKNRGLQYPEIETKNWK